MNARADEYVREFADRGLLPSSPIEAQTAIGVSAAEVWAAIGERGNLERLHPFCASNVVERWPGPASRDHVHYYSGLHYERDVLDWREREGYDIAVGPPSGKIAVARWWIEPSGDAACRFGIEVTSFIRSGGSPESRARYEATVIKAAIPPYLEAVVAGVRHYSETGEPVVRNQFGSHEVYSPPTP